MSDPTVTILMSVYNGEKYLEQAVDSMLAQTYGDFEFLVINDGSSDRSRAILDGYKDPRMRVVDNEGNIGLTKSLNRGIRMSKSRYIARMDADDVSMPDRLEKEVRFLDAHPEIGAVGCNVRLIDGDGNDAGAMAFPETSGHIRWYMLFFNPLAHPSMLIRREALERAGGYNEEIRYAQDYELWCRMAPTTRFWNLQETLLCFRMHGQKVSVKNTAEQTRFFDDIKRDYAYSLIGERLSPEDMRAMQESRQGDSGELPLVFYRLSMALLQDSLISRQDKKLIRRDAAKKVLYRYDFLRNKKRLEAVRRSFELSPTRCVAMLAYDLFYMIAGHVRG